MNKKLTQLLHSTLFIITIVGVGVVSLVKQPMTMEAVKTDSILNGETARTLENNYDDNLFIKSLGVNLWAAIEYLAFNEGKDGLVIGEDDWLFTAEEFHTSSDSVTAFDNNIELIKWVSQEFTKKNIALLVVPVPAKARVYHDKLNTQPATLHQQSYAALLNELRTATVAVTDSLSAMQTAKTNNAQFLRTDTHWTPAGAKTIANNAAIYIKEHLALTLNNQSFTTELKQTQVLNGDLFNYLPLSPWFDHLLPEPDQLAVYETYADSTEDLDGLFGESTDAIALVGTSYSANPNWNFAGALKQALAADIINYAEEGHGPIKPMMQFLKTHQTEMPDLELVIWEIPERYLTVAYHEAYAQRAQQDMRQTLIAQQLN